MEHYEKRFHFPQFSWVIFYRGPKRLIYVGKCFRTNFTSFRHFLTQVPKLLLFLWQKTFNLFSFYFKVSSCSSNSNKTHWNSTEAFCGQHQFLKKKLSIKFSHDNPLNATDNKLCWNNCFLFYSQSNILWPTQEQLDEENSRTLRYVCISF